MWVPPRMSVSCAGTGGYGARMRPTLPSTSRSASPHRQSSPRSSPGRGSRDGRTPTSGSGTCSWNASRTFGLWRASSTGYSSVPRSTGRLSTVRWSVGLSRPMSSPHVAVVVLTWNGEDDTLACLASLGRVEYDNLSVVVVDNGSADRTVLRVRTEFPEVAVLETGANLGFAAGNNVGIQHALDRGAEYVFLLNNDTEVDPELIRHLVDAAEPDASAGVLGPKVFFFSHRDRLWYAGGWVQRWAGASGHIGLGELDRNG